MAFQKAFEVAMEHLDRADPNICSLAIRRLEELLFPNKFERKVKLWITKCNCTRVTTWGQQVLLKNLKIALFKERLGLGPETYCRMHNASPSFSAKVALIFTCLPPRKFCVYPFGDPIRGILSNPKWIDLNRTICKKSLPKKLMYPLCPSCNSFWCEEGQCIVENYYE